jgi:hypothetical protein
LEVTDNGSGLDPSDYETLGMTLPKKLARMWALCIDGIYLSFSSQALYIEIVKVWGSRGCGHFWVSGRGP